MTLYEKWSKKAYDGQGQNEPKVWNEYLPLEQRFYERMIESGEPAIKGKLSDLAKKNGMTPEYFCGLLDGIKEALNEGLDVEKLTPNTEINVSTTFERLYKKMVEYKAEHLYSLPQWNGIFTEGQQKVYYTEQRRSTTVVRDSAKVGRNEPCPCGSGKKFKHCCS